MLLLLSTIGIAVGMWPVFRIDAAVLARGGCFMRCPPIIHP